MKGSIHIKTDMHTLPRCVLIHWCCNSSWFHLYSISSLIGDQCICKTVWSAVCLCHNETIEVANFITNFMFFIFIRMYSFHQTNSLFSINFPVGVWWGFVMFNHACVIQVMIVWEHHPCNAFVPGYANDLTADHHKNHNYHQKISACKNQRLILILNKK